MSDALHTITGLEIFRVGKWNGDDYDLESLQAMVDAFPHVGFQPPVKLGHSDKVGERAYGWVSRIYRVGEKLLADLRDIPSEVYRLIKEERAWDHCSVEIFWDLERGGRVYRRVLKALALLGAEMPAVGGLNPIRSVVHAVAGEWRSYSFPMMKGEESMTYTSPTDAGIEIDRRIRELQERDPKLDYATGRNRVLEADATLKALYVHGLVPKREQRQGAALTVEAAGEKLHVMTLARMEARNCSSYSQAMREVLAAPGNEDLKAAYTRC